MAMILSSARRALPAAAAAVLLLALAGCDSESDGRATAAAIAQRISEVCGVAEGREAGGPRTVTPIDLDGQDGPTGYLVTCVNGKTSYVTAVK